MTTAFPADLREALRCPVCRATLSEQGETLTCTGCERAFPIVLGIPDLRLYEDPLIPKLDDYRKGEKLQRAAESMSFAELVAFYWTLPTYPPTPADLSARFIHHVLTDERRIAGWEPAHRHRRHSPRRGMRRGRARPVRAPTVRARRRPRRRLPLADRGQARARGGGDHASARVWLCRPSTLRGEQLRRRDVGRPAGARAGRRCDARRVRARAETYGSDDRLDFESFLDRSRAARTHLGSRLPPASPDAGLRALATRPRLHWKDLVVSIRAGALGAPRADMAASSSTCRRSPRRTWSTPAASSGWRRRSTRRFGGCRCSAGRSPWCSPRSSP